MLSFLPNPNNPDEFLVTSNRDESSERATLPPGIYEENGVKLCFPKDSVAGGTWIGASNKKRITCLLNGAFKPHERAESYRMSRGLVVKKMLMAESGEEFFKNFDLQGIEQFMIINIEWKDGVQLHQFIWDGAKKYAEQLPVEPHIRMSGMLYFKEEQDYRKQKFREELKNLKSISPEDPKKSLLDFHSRFRLDRGLLKTTSTTQIIKTNKGLNINYLDLLTNKSFALDF